MIKQGCIPAKKWKRYKKIDSVLADGEIHTLGSILDSLNYELYPANHSIRLLIDLKGMIATGVMMILNPGHAKAVFYISPEKQLSDDPVVSRVKRSPKKDDTETIEMNNVLNERFGTRFMKDKCKQ